MIYHDTSALSNEAASCSIMPKNLSESDDEAAAGIATAKHHQGSLVAFLELVKILCQHKCSRGRSCIAERLVCDTM